MQIKDRQQLLTILAGVAIALLIIDKIVAPPLTNFWQARAKQITDLQAQVKHGQQMRLRRNGIRADWAEIQAASLTNNATVADEQLQRGIDQWSESSGVMINSITPQEKDSSDPGYKTIECRVDAAGSIDRVTRFLYDLENDPMALKLQIVELTASDNTGQQLAMGVQVSGLILTPNGKTK